MAKKKRRQVKSINDVVMPGRFISYFHPFFEKLQAKITREAYAIAFERKTGPDVGYVTYEDVVKSARKILPKATAELLENLKPSEPDHAPRKSA